MSEWRVRVAINDRLSEDSARTFADAADRAAEMVVDHIQTPESCTLESISRLAASLPPPVQQEPIKLTREQWAAVRAAAPTYPPWAAPNLLSGVPVVLVDDERDSTLYRPPVEAVGVFETFDGDGPEFGPLPPAVDGDTEERVCEPERAPRRRWWRWQR